MGDAAAGSGRAGQGIDVVLVTHLGRGFQRAGSVLELGERAGVRGWRSGLRGWRSGLRGWRSGLRDRRSGIRGWRSRLRGWHSGLRIRFPGPRRGRDGIGRRLAGIRPCLPGVRPRLTSLRRKRLAEPRRPPQRRTGLRRGRLPRHGHGHLLLRPRARRQRLPELAPGQALGIRHAATDERGRRTQRVRTHGPRSRHQHSGVAALVGSRGARGARRSRWPWGWGSRAPRWSRCSLDYCHGLPAVSAPPDVSAETIEASAILRRHADMNLKPRRSFPQVGKIGAHRTDIVANLHNVAPQCCMLVA